MQEIFLLSFLTGGLVELTREYGGVDYYLTLLVPYPFQKGCRIWYCRLVSLADMLLPIYCAIVLLGQIAKELAEKHGVSAKKVLVSR